MAIKINDILQSYEDGSNLAEQLDAEELRKIAGKVLDDYKQDKESRADWERKVSEGMKLALQVFEKKTTPWEGASNVKLPLITIPCLQFSSRIYPALISGTDIVRMRVIGEDPTGEKTARAKRVSTHMSYQVLEEDEQWEAEMDAMFVTLPLVGCAFKKIYFDPDKQHNCSKHVFAKDLVVNYYATCLEDAACITHRIIEYRNEYESKFRQGIYKQIELPDSNYQPDYLDNQRDQAIGTYDNEGEKPYLTLEQHRYLDLDGDGYAEPYVVTVNHDAQEVVRITPRFSQEDVIYIKNKIAKIKPIHHFKRYLFIPSPDGSIYGLGFYRLLGPLNESANTLVNQLIDAGSLMTKGGGFVGRGARIKGGHIKLDVGKWKQVNVTGEDLAKSFYQPPLPNPSAVLFNLLSLLIDYTERVSSVSEMMVGKTPGQNTPATTSMAALEQGQQVFLGIHKRVYRDLRGEFRMLYRLNQKYLNESQYYEVLDTGEESQVFQIDYFGDPTDIRPTADPNVFSNVQRLNKAMAVAQRSDTNWMYDKFQVEQRILSAMQVEAIDQILPPQTLENGEPNPKAPQPPTDPKIDLETKKFQSKTLVDAEKLRMQQDELVAKLEKMRTECIKNIADAEAAEEGIQMDAYQQELDFINRQMELVNEQRRLSGMENAPGNEAGNATP